MARKNSSFEQDEINALCLGQCVAEYLIGDIDSREKIGLWLIQM